MQPAATKQSVFYTEAVIVTEIHNAIAAAFDTYPELDAVEILRLCRPANERLLHHALREHFQATIREIRTRLKKGE